MSERLFVHPGQISKHLKCSTCFSVFQKPVSIDCGHTFCHECLSKWQKKNNNCTECRLPIKGMRKDLLADKIIQDLEVFCMNKPLCVWQGPLGNLEAHMVKCDMKSKVVKEYLRDDSQSKKLQNIEDDELLEKIQLNDQGGSLMQRLYAKNDGQVRKLLDQFHDKPAQTEQSDDILDLFFDVQSEGESSQHKEGKFNQKRRTQTMKEKASSPFRVTKTL